MKKLNIQRGTKNKPLFEECYSKIEVEIEKRRPLWSYNYAWIDFDDIKMMIFSHINQKWHLYDDNYPLLNWVNRIISNQLKNFIRNFYGHFAPPCASCEHFFHDGNCGLYGKPNNKCELYKHWSSKKQSKFNIRMAVTAENHQKEISLMPSENINFEKAFNSIKDIANKNLNPIELKVFNYLYIEHRSDLETMRLMNYKPVIIDGKKYCKQLDIIKKRIIEKIKTSREDIELQLN